MSAIRDVHDGGAGSIRALHKVGCCFKNVSETQAMSLAESTVKPKTARPLIIPGIPFRRDKNERGEEAFFRDSLDLNHELFLLLVFQGHPLLLLYDRRRHDVSILRLLEQQYYSRCLSSDHDEV